MKLDKKITIKKILLLALVLGFISSILDVIFFQHLLYKNIYGSFFLFFIRSFIEIAFVLLGIVAGYLIKTMELK